MHTLGVAVDPATFSEVYRRHAPEVIGYLTHMSGDRGLAEDIAAETFLKIWSSPVPLEMPTVRAYIFRIARNLLFEHHRKRGREEPLLNHDVSSGAGAQDARDEVHAILTELAAFGEIERSAFVMKVLQEMSYAEIAAVLRTTEVSARVAVHRARKKLMDVRERSVAR